ASTPSAAAAAEIASRRALMTVLLSSTRTFGATLRPCFRSVGYQPVNIWRRTHAAGSFARTSRLASPRMIEVNRRWYRRPGSPPAVVCLDGVDPAYLDDAFARKLTPRLAELADAGTYVRGLSQLPSFTNPNNLSIVTGAPPSVHGVSGNHYRS